MTVAQFTEAPIFGGENTEGLTLREMQGLAIECLCVDETAVWRQWAAREETWPR